MEESVNKESNIYIVKQLLIMIERSLAQIIA
jgi:hypothetical protein